MLNKILKNLSEVIYVQVIENGYIVSINGGAEEVTFYSETPFSTQRLAVGDFLPADTLLTDIIKKTKRRLLQPSPIIIMHQIVKNEGGLSPVEVRILRELADGAGAIQGYVWQGHKLTEEDIKNEVYKTNI